MSKFSRYLAALLCTLGLTMTLHAQQHFFADIAASSIPVSSFKKVINPQKSRTSIVSDVESLQRFLWSLPSEETLFNRQQAPTLVLPMPDGSNASFRVWESSIQEPALAAKFPESRTFAGQGIDDPYATIRFDYTPFGFHAQILSVNGNVYIDPYARGDIHHYMSYYTRENSRNTGFVCSVPENAESRLLNVTAGPCRGTQLYKYRLAVACTGEYAAAVGGTTAALLHAAIVTTVNRVDGVYENEVAVRLILIANNNLLEFLTPALDPFSPSANNDGGILIDESQTFITSIIGTANFDIGHTFSTGGGGLAGLGVVCDASSKALGVTGLSNPVGDDYDIDYVAHEIGHQFGGDHTFNSVTSSCGGNRNGSTAYEVGSGTTIMAYAGICGSDDIQPHSDPFFHTISFDEISNFIEAGGTCKVASATGNNLPQITSMNNNDINIPINTPFTLTATATDADGDALTYCWEEWDLGPSGAWNAGATSTTAPLFKSRAPKTTGSRTFPDIARIIANYLPAVPPANMGGLKGETLPTVARNIKFRLTVRDNRSGGGGVVTGGDGCQTGYTGIFQVHTIAGTGPFTVNFPNGGESWAGGSTQTITWNVAGTNAAPINTTSVKISLSTDGGLTYPTVLLASTVNDGSESITVPTLPSATTTARVKVEAINNIFFDISNNNFSISLPPSTFSFDNTTSASITCGQTSGAVTLPTSSVGGFITPANLTASGNPAGTTVSFSVNPVTPGNSTVVTLNNTTALTPGTYNITVTGVAGTVTQNTTLTYIIQPIANPVINTQPVSQVVCVGGNATFNTQVSGTVNYQWQVSIDGGVTFNDITGATAASYTITGVTAPIGNNLYHVVVTTLCGLTVSDNVSVTVNTAPTITAQVTNAIVCTGGTSTFTVTASGGGLTYQWQLSSNGGTSYANIPGATANSYTLPGITLAENNNLYQVIVSGSCGSPVTSNAGLLTVNAPPVVTASASENSVCTGTDVLLTASGATTYSWSPISSTDNPVHVFPTVNAGNPTVPNPVTYTVTGSNGNGCDATATVTVIANPLPVVSLTATPAVTKILPGQTVLLTATVSPSTGFVFSWTKDGVLIPNFSGSSRIISIDDIGTYQVTAADENTGACSNQSLPVTIQDSMSDRLFIWPVPNDGHFNVSYYNPGAVNTVQQLVIYDSKGSRVYRKAFPVGRTYTTLQVNLTGVATGMFVVELTDKAGNRLATEKILVH